MPALRVSCELRNAAIPGNHSFHQQAGPAQLLAQKTCTTTVVADRIDSVVAAANDGVAPALKRQVVSGNGSGDVEAGDAALEHLQILVSLIETYFHPSNSGSCAHSPLPNAPRHASSHSAPPLT